jgi:hypothetical protein
VNITKLLGKIIDSEANLQLLLLHTRRPEYCRLGSNDQPSPFIFHTLLGLCLRRSAKLFYWMMWS